MCWNLIFQEEPTKAQAATFRAMMSWALFVIESDEYERVKDKLKQKLGQAPTKKEICKECASIILCPQILAERIYAVLNYFYYCDLRLDLKSLQHCQLLLQEPKVQLVVNT
jgi:hypothetical protein